MSQSYILAIDIGTSSVRVGLYDLKGNLLPRTLVKNERLLKTTADGGAEIDAEEAFQQVVGAIDDIMERSSDIKGEIIAVASCSFWHSLMGIDKKGKPSTKVFGWADTRSRNYVSALRNKFDEIRVHNRTGARFHSSFWPAKLLWLRNEVPEPFARTDKWLSLSDFVAQKLFDSSDTSISMASATGIFNVRKLDWDTPLLKFLKIKVAMLPRIAERSEAFSLNSKFAKRWSRLADTEWFPAIGDGAANNIGARCVSKTTAALMIGTSGAARVAYKGDLPDKIPTGLWCYRIDGERVIVGGALSDGGGLYRWLHENLRIEDTVDAEIAKRPPDGHGLTFLPFLAGERSTGYHEFATGAILGMRSSTDAVDIAQAAMESVAYRFAEILDQLKEIGNIREIVASGGALRESPVWTQIIADVLGRNLVLPRTHEASMRGAVLLALESLGNIESIEQSLSLTGRTFGHNAERHALYEKAGKRHQAAYDLIIKNR